MLKDAEGAGLDFALESSLVHKESNANRTEGNTESENPTRTMLVVSGKANIDIWHRMGLIIRKSPDGMNAA